MSCCRRSDPKRRSSSLPYCRATSSARRRASRSTSVRFWMMAVRATAAMITTGSRINPACQRKTGFRVGRRLVIDRRINTGPTLSRRKQNNCHGIVKCGRGIAGTGCPRLGKRSLMQALQHRGRITGVRPSSLRTRTTGERLSLSCFGGEESAPRPASTEMRVKSSGDGRTPTKAGLGGGELRQRRNGNGAGRGCFQGALQPIDESPFLKHVSAGLRKQL